jgi:ribosome-binding protein aMBF1 (putative translation factor)
MFSRKANIQIHSVSPVLSEAIRQCRIAAGMSPEQLAKKIRKSSDFVNDLEQALIAIDSQILEDCASALGLSSGEMVNIAISFPS